MNPWCGMSSPVNMLGMRWVVAASAAVMVLAGCGTSSESVTASSVTTASPRPSVAWGVSDGARPASPVTKTVTVTYTPPPPPGPQTTIRTDGTYAVGVDILPGVYRSSGTSKPGRDCYYKRLASFDSSDIIDNEGTEGPQVVQIMASDAAFVTSNCLPWTRAPE